MIEGSSICRKYTAWYDRGILYHRGSIQNMQPLASELVEAHIYCPGSWCGVHQEHGFCKCWKCADPLNYKRWPGPAGHVHCPNTQWHWERHLGRTCNARMCAWIYFPMTDRILKSYFRRWASRNQTKQYIFLRCLEATFLIWFMHLSVSVSLSLGVVLMFIPMCTILSFPKWP